MKEMGVNNACSG